MIDETELLNLAIANIRKVLEFNPYKSYSGVSSREEFKRLIERDPAFGVLGLNFEVRSCYQIGDSKRIQADYDMALALKAYSILPVMLIFCNTSLRSPVARLSKSWELYEGMDSFNLVTKITGFNLYNFLLNNSQTFKQEIDNILTNF